MAKYTFYHREMLSLAPVNEIFIHMMTTEDNLFYMQGDDDATDPQCQIQSVPNVLEGNILNHVCVTTFSGIDSNILFFSLDHMKVYLLAVYFALELAFT